MEFNFLVILATAFLLQTAGFFLALLLFSKERKGLLRMLLESRGIPDPDKQIKNREGKLRRILEDWRAKRTAREIEKSAEERSGSGR